MLKWNDNKLCFSTSLHFSFVPDASFEEKDDEEEKNKLNKWISHRKSTLRDLPPIRAKNLSRVSQSYPWSVYINEACLEKISFFFPFKYRWLKKIVLIHSSCWSVVLRWKVFFSSSSFPPVWLRFVCHPIVLHSSLENIALTFSFLLPFASPAF